MGAGLGFAYLPVSGIVSKHFTKRRSLGMGIITTGTSLGGFTFSVLTNKLLSTGLGFAWTVRIIAFITLGCILCANLLVSQPKERSVGENEIERERVAATTGGIVEEEVRPRSITQLLRDPAYLAIISSGFIVCLGLYFPM